MVKILSWLIGIGLLFGAMTANAPKTEVERIEKQVTKTESPETSISTPSGEIKNLYKVVKVIDGDTVQLDIGGKRETLRLIGLDTPESVDPRKPVQCFALEASKKAKEILSGKKVSLEADGTQGDKDNYNRLLRYVFLEDGTNFNKLMISEGYGHEYTYNKPYKYREEFKLAETEATLNKKGLWADKACLVTITPTAAPEVKAVATSAPVKKISSSPSTGGGSYNCGTKTKCGEMSNCAEARYFLTTCGLTRLDADHDGVPCESICN